MQIQASRINAMTAYPTPFARVQNKDDSENTHRKSINAVQMKMKQSQNNQNSAMKALPKQIQRLEESIEKIKQDEKMPEKEKAAQIQEVQKQIQDLQRQVAETQQKEEEKRIREQEEKRAAEEAKHLSSEENEKKAQEAQQKVLTGFAVASEHLKVAEPLYHKVKKYETEGKLGMGPKYGGNLSAAAVEGRFIKAARYGKAMLEELNSADHLSKLALMASKEYKKHKKEADASKDEEKGKEPKLEIEEYI